MTSIVRLHCCNCGAESVGALTGNQTDEGFEIEAEDTRNKGVVQWMRSHRSPVAELVRS